MNVCDIVKNKTNFKIGCQVRAISEGHLIGRKMKCRKLKKKPGKITAHFLRDKITAVYKATPRRADSEFYLIKTVDNTVFQINY